MQRLVGTSLAAILEMRSAFLWLLFVGDVSPGQWRLCNPLILSFRFGVRRTLDVNFAGSCSMQRICSSMCFALSINGPLPFAARGEHIDARVTEPLGDQKGTAVAMHKSSAFLTSVVICSPLTEVVVRWTHAILKRVVTRATARL